jgi:copper chaperone CopZ
VTALATAELIDEVAEKLKLLPGIIAVSGNENAVTVAYDPGVITVARIRESLASMGHAVK